jgi:hypothetical protein
MGDRGVSQTPRAADQSRLDAALMVADRPMQRDQIVAAFDFDGTITTSDSLRDFVRYTCWCSQTPLAVVVVDVDVDVR